MEPIHDCERHSSAQAFFGLGTRRRVAIQGRLHTRKVRAAGEGYFMQEVSIG